MIETIRIFGSHPIGFEVDNAYLANKQNEQQGILPQVYAWDDSTVNQVVEAKPQLLAVDSMHPVMSEFGFFYTLPTTPSRLRFDNQDTFVLLGDITADDFLFPSAEFPQIGSYLRAVGVQMECGWLGDEFVARTLSKLKEFEEFYDSLSPEQRVERDLEVLQRYRRLVRPPAYSVEPTLLRNALVQLKIHDLPNSLSEKIETSVILFGTAHRFNENAWDNKDVLQSRVAKVARDILTLYLNDAETSSKDFPKAISELTSFFSSTGIIRLIDSLGSEKLNDNYRLGLLYESPAIAEIVETVASELLNS